MLAIHQLMMTACAVLATGATLHASILGTHWKRAGPDTWELYAELAPGYRLTNADLADTLINEPPAGINHGLFISNGSFVSVTLTIGDEPGIPARNPTFLPADTGTQLNAAWFVLDGVSGNTIDATSGGTVHAVRILSVEITPGARLGGIGPDGSTPSSIFLFANDGTPNVTTRGVFEIPPTPTCVGDINGDNTVDLADFNILGINFGAGPEATHAQGDLNDDGFVNLADFNILGINFGNTCP